MRWESETLLWGRGAAAPVVPGGAFAELRGFGVGTLPSGSGCLIFEMEERAASHPRALLRPPLRRAAAATPGVSLSVEKYPSLGKTSKKSMVWRLLLWEVVEVGDLAGEGAVPELLVRRWAPNAPRGERALPAPQAGAGADGSALRSAGGTPCRVSPGCRQPCPTVLGAGSAPRLPARGPQQLQLRLHGGLGCPVSGGHGGAPAALQGGARWGRPGRGRWSRAGGVRVPRRERSTGPAAVSGAAGQASVAGQVSTADEEGEPGVSGREDIPNEPERCSGDSLGGSPGSPLHTAGPGPGGLSPPALVLQGRPVGHRLAWRRLCCWASLDSPCRRGRGKEGPCRRPLGSVQRCREQGTSRRPAPGAEMAGATGSPGTAWRGHQPCSG